MVVAQTQHTLQHYIYVTERASTFKRYSIIFKENAPVDHNIVLDCGIYKLNTIRLWSEK